MPQFTWPPAKSSSWYIPAPGRLVISIPKAMGTSSRGSNFFTMARYSRMKEMTSIAKACKFPLAI